MMLRNGLLFGVVAFAGLCAIAEPAAACSVCFGEESHPQTEGMNMAILTLLGVTWGVLGMMGTAGFVFWRRTRLLSIESDSMTTDGDVFGDGDADS